MFREIPGYKNYYINESGIVKDQYENLLKIAVNNDCRMYTIINGNIEYIDNLIAKTYFRIDHEYKFPVHIDGDPLNNHVTNIKISKNKEKNLTIPNRSNRSYSSGTNIYEVFNDVTGDIVECIGRGQVAELIQYEEISLKNMVGNGRKITLGPYKGYQIRRKIYN